MGGNCRGLCKALPRNSHGGNEGNHENTSVNIVYFLVFHPEVL